MKSARRLIVLLLFISTNEHFADAQQVDSILLKDYRPVSIYDIPKTKIEKARYPVIDFHSHDYPKDEASVKDWIRVMDEVGVSKSIILTYSTGKRFDSIAAKYAPYHDRFEVWCGFDYTDFDKPGWQQKALTELERCHKMGATGVGELGDKGLGELYSHPVPGYGIHIDNEKLQPLIRRCGELHMPISIHVAEDAWMYEAPDLHNDGLMNSAKWHVDQTKQGLLSHDELLKTLETAVDNNPHTIFIACHLANSCSNLSRLGEMLDKFPNLYADIAARYAEIAPTPRVTKNFIEKYADRIVYGTDMGPEKDMYETTFRILESADDHFYEFNRFGYHWPLYGLDLSESALKKIYSANSRKILAH